MTIKAIQGHIDDIERAIDSFIADTDMFLEDKKNYSLHGDHLRDWQDRLSRIRSDLHKLYMRID